MKHIKEKVFEMKAISPGLSAISSDVRNDALKAVAKALIKNKAEIFAANDIDMAKAESKGISVPIKKRLKFGEDKLNDVVGGIESLISLSDPIGKITLSRELDEGLKLYRETCPIGAH